MTKQIRKLWMRFAQWFPLVWKRDANANLAAKLEAQRRELDAAHQRNLELDRRRVDELVSRVTQIGWQRTGTDVYRLNLQFHAQLMYGFKTNDELKWIAQMIARQVEAEIASSRFIQKAESDAIHHYSRLSRGPDEETKT